MNQKVTAILISVKTFFTKATSISVLMNILMMASICFLLLAFDSNINDWFKNNLLPVFSNVSGTLLAKTLFWICVIVMITSLVWEFYVRYCLKKLVWISLMMGIFAYWYFRTKFHYEAEPKIVCDLGYSDIITIVISMSVVISIYNRYLRPAVSKSENSESELTDDNAITHPSQDKFGFDESAKDLAALIKKLPSISSYSIGIIGSWGSGKTSFINLLSRYFDEKEYKIIRFNPRNASSSSNIQEDFFRTLNDDLSSYDGQYAGLMSRYLKNISLGDNNIISTIVNTLTEILDNEDTKSQIGDILLRHWKRVIVVIEDFDRLTSEEIIEILKLIDCNATFAGMLFIAAYDKNHIASILTEGRHGSKYIEKYFNLEYHLPLRPYTTIYKYLEDEILKITGNSEYIKPLVIECNEYFKNYLKTFREAKQFLNQFRVSYPKVGSEVEFTDFIIILLIRKFYYDEYVNLSRNNVAEEWYFSVEQTERDELIKKYPNSEPLLLRLLDRKKSARSFNNPLVYMSYFWEEVYGRISYANLMNLVNQNNDFREDFRKYMSMNLESQVLKFLTYYVDSIKDSSELKRYIELLTYPFVCHPFDALNMEFYSLFGVLLTDNQINELSERTNTSVEEIKEWIFHILRGSGNQIPYRLNNQLIHRIKQGLVSPRIITDTEMLSINKTNFNQYCERNHEFTDKHYMLLLGCVSHIDPHTNIVHLDLDSCHRMNIIIIEDPERYFDSFVRLGMESTKADYNSIACDGFWRQIFRTPENLEHIIMGLPEDYAKKELLVNFWTLFKNNNFNHIQFDGQGNVQKKIDNGLKQEIESFHNFERIRDKFAQNEYDVVSQGKSWMLLKNLAQETRQEIFENVRLPLSTIYEFSEHLGTFLR